MRCPILKFPNIYGPDKKDKFFRNEDGEETKKSVKGKECHLKKRKKVRTESAAVQSKALSPMLPRTFDL